MSYDVHLFRTVRIKLTDVEGATPAEAAKHASASLNLHGLLDNSAPAMSGVDCVEAEPDERGYSLVDCIGKAGDIAQAIWLDHDGHPLIDNKTSVERKADRADQAIAFMDELLDSFETLSGIAEQFGSRTLTDLIYLQAAILKGEQIDHWPDESPILEVVRALPSASDWTQAIKSANEGADRQQPNGRPTGA